MVVLDYSAAFSTTIKEVRSTILACRWAKHWTKFANRSDGSSTRKRGVALRQFGRSAGCIDQSLDEVRGKRETIRDYVDDI